MTKDKVSMNNISIRNLIKIFYHALLYFFINGFMVLFLVNLFLQELIWPFFSGIFLVTFLNLLFSISGMYLGIQKSSSILLSGLLKTEKKKVIAQALAFFVFMVVLANLFVYSYIDRLALILQLFYSVVLVGIFAYLSYNSIIKNNKEI